MLQSPFKDDFPYLVHRQEMEQNPAITCHEQSKLFGSVSDEKMKSLKMSTPDR